MNTLIPETLLPNGMKVFYLQKNEVQLIYEEVQTYLNNGIELHEGDTVFDVGANIGIFTLWVHQLCNKNVNVYAFEPIPAIFEVLQRNVQRWGSEKLKVFSYGLGQESKTVSFAYHPNAPAMSSAYQPDVSKPELEKCKNSILYNLNDAPAFIRRLRWIPPLLRSLILDKALKRAFQTEQVSCQLKTLSEIVAEHGIHQIDLLKVDVEKSELDVLLGIELRDWSKIKQVVVEVHDLDSRVEKITTLLKEQGLDKITVEQESYRKSSRIFNIYALRQKSDRDSLALNAHKPLAT